MKTQLKADAAEPTHNAHTIRLHCDDTPEDQALYAALSASSDREYRTPLPRQIKYLLAMAMGLTQPDLFLLKRLGFSSVDPYEFGVNALAAYVPPPPPRPPTTEQERTTRCREPKKGTHHETNRSAAPPVHGVRASLGRRRAGQKPAAAHMPT